MIDTGREILREEGIQTGSTNLTFKRVFDRVERETGRRLTNASVIRRVWDNQADFQADVLVTVAHDQDRPEVADTLAAVQSVLASADRSTPEGRLAAMSELCRVAGAASHRVIAESPSWALWVAVVTIATTTTDEGQRRRMCEALAEGYASMTEFWAGVYGGLMTHLGLRLRAPRTLDQFATAVSSLTEGNSFRRHAEGHTVTLDLPTGPDGEVRSGPSTPWPSRRWRCSSSNPTPPGRSSTAGREPDAPSGVAPHRARTRRSARPTRLRGSGASHVVLRGRATMGNGYGRDILVPAVATLPHRAACRRRRPAVRETHRTTPLSPTLRSRHLRCVSA